MEPKPTLYIIPVPEVHPAIVDTVGWLDSILIYCPGAEVTWSELYTKYCTWAEDRGYLPVPTRKLARMIQGQRRKTNGEVKLLHVTWRS